MMEELRKNAIYVMHALTGYEYHEKRVIELFRRHGLNFEFVTDGDPIHFTEELLSKYFVTDIKKILSRGSLSCTLNHILTYEKMVERKNKYAIIFEDDPIFLSDFCQRLEAMSAEIEMMERGFIISLENSSLRFPSYWQTSKGKHVYLASKGRMAGAYLVDLEGATRILQHLKQTKCHTIIDWWHNTLTEQGVIKMYWAHPPLVEQGSLNGQMNSTNSSKPSIWSRRLGWVVQKNFKWYVRRLFKETRIID